MGGPSIKGSSRMWSVAKAQTWNTLTVCLFFLFVLTLENTSPVNVISPGLRKKSLIHWTSLDPCVCFKLVFTQLGFPVIPAGFSSLLAQYFRLFVDGIPDGVGDTLCRHLVRHTLHRSGDGRHHLWPPGEILKKHVDLIGDALNHGLTLWGSNIQVLNII